MSSIKENKVGLIGLGKMGKNIGLQMLQKGYKVVAYNRSKEPLAELSAKGAQAADSIEDLVKKLDGRKVVWVMLTAGEVTENTIVELSKLLNKNDIVIDGSNSNYKESIKLSKILGEKDIQLIDAGCSGGPSGALNGMSIMIGGEQEPFKYAEKLFKELSVENGYLYVGKAGSGHFVKMIHNAIEYGMMQSIGEGMDLLKNGPYDELNLVAISGLWNNGSVIRGYLIELTKRALEKDGKLSGIEPYVEDNGEGRWAIQTAVDYGIPFNVIASSLFERFSSRSKDHFSARMLAALRHEFGGHDVKKSEE